jgi:hypothetical protein
MIDLSCDFRESVVGGLVSDDTSMPQDIAAMSDYLEIRWWRDGVGFSTPGNRMPISDKDKVSAKVKVLFI